MKPSFRSTAAVFGGWAFAAALHAAPALDAYGLSAAGQSRVGAAGPPFSCSTYGPDPRTAFFGSVMQFGLPTDGPVCGVTVSDQFGSTAAGSATAASSVSRSFGTVGDPRSYDGESLARARYGDLGVRATASHSGSVDSFTVTGTQAFARQTETMTFGGASGTGTFRPTFTIDGSLFNVGRTDSELSFHWQAGSGPTYLTWRSNNRRGEVEFYDRGYVTTMPGMTITGTPAGGYTVAGTTTFSFDVPISFGSPIDITYGLWLAVLPSSSVNQPGPSAGATEFLNSARLTGIEVLDAGGRPVAGFTIAAGSGTLYGPGGVVAVPEPGSAALLLAGGALLLGWRRRG